jgi:hypothetical protein
MGMEANRHSGGDKPALSSYAQQAARQALNLDPQTGQPLPKKRPVMTGDVSGFKPDKLEPEQPKDLTLAFENTIRDNIDRSLRKQEDWVDAGRRGKFDDEYKKAADGALSGVSAGYVQSVGPVAPKVAEAVGTTTRKLSAKVMEQLTKRVTDARNSAGVAPLTENGKIVGGLMPNNIHNRGKDGITAVLKSGQSANISPDGQITPMRTLWNTPREVLKKLVHGINTTFKDPVKASQDLDLDTIEQVTWGAR